MNLHEYDHVVGSLSRDFAKTDLELGMLFPWSVLRMNQMYGLPVNQQPTLEGLGESPLKRMQGFMKTLADEMREGQEIMAFMVFREWLQSGAQPTTEQLIALCEKMEVTDPKCQSDLITLMGKFANRLKAEAQEAVLKAVDEETLVMLADWFGDMNVYNRSEALKYGLPLEEVLACIMGSNFTKLNPDGTATKDSNGKVQKGPNFRPPEAHIHTTLFERAAIVAEYERKVAELEKVQQLTAQVAYGSTNAMFELNAVAEAHKQILAISNDPDLEDDEEEMAEGPAHVGDPLFG